MTIVESEFAPPAQLERMREKMDVIAARASELAVAQAVKILARLEKLHPGHKFVLFDGMGSTSVQITPPLTDGENAFDSIMSYYWEDEMKAAQDPKVKKAIQACGYIFQLSDYLNDSFKYELGHVTSTGAE